MSLDYSVFAKIAASRRLSRRLKWNLPRLFFAGAPFADALWIRYLNVHEGPIGIGGGTVSGDKIKVNQRMKRMWLAPIEEGMYLSDEPGFYKSGEFGIRIESDLVVVSADTRFAFGARPWLRFEYLTKVPFCRALIDTSLLSMAEKDWINAYHEDVRETLMASLAEEDQGPSRESKALQAFLVAATEPL
eukprot:COSAG02_NODE_6894_length_3302_cov_1.871995_2_plen_189_part_00